MLFLELWRDSRVTKGNSGFLLCWPREVQSSIRVVRESGGLLSSYRRAKDAFLEAMEKLLAIKLRELGQNRSLLIA